MIDVGSATDHSGSSLLILWKTIIPYTQYVSGHGPSIENGITPKPGAEPGLTGIQWVPFSKNCLMVVVESQEYVSNRSRVAMTNIVIAIILFALLMFFMHRRHGGVGSCGSYHSHTGHSDRRLDSSQNDAHIHGRDT